MLAALNANDLLEETQKESEKLMINNSFMDKMSPIDPMSSIYIRFLNEGISKQNLLNQK